MTILTSRFESHDMSAYQTTTTADDNIAMVNSKIHHTFDIEVTPAMAKDWLTVNTINRKLSLYKITAYTEAIKRGEWLHTHQGMAFDTNGDMLDGQHRCHAIIAADRSVKTKVTVGLPPKTFTAMDTGMKRTMADLTGLSRRRVDVINKICKLAYGNAWSYKSNFDQFTAIDNIFGRATEALSASTPSTRSGLSSAGVRAAVAIRIVQFPREAERDLEIYRSMILMHVTEIPASIGALIRASERLSTYSDELLLSAYVAFDPKSERISKLTFRDLEGRIEELRNMVRAIVQKHGEKYGG